MTRTDTQRLARLCQEKLGVEYTLALRTVHELYAARRLAEPLHLSRPENILRVQQHLRDTRDRDTAPADPEPATTPPAHPSDTPNPTAGLIAPGSSPLRPPFLPPR